MKRMPFGNDVISMSVSQFEETVVVAERWEERATEAEQEIITVRGLLRDALRNDAGWQDRASMYFKTCQRLEGDE